MRTDAHRCAQMCTYATCCRALTRHTDPHAFTVVPISQNRAERVGQSPHAQLGMTYVVVRANYIQHRSYLAHDQHVYYRISFVRHTPCTPFPSLLRDTRSLLS
ncbi:unnamed protein product [Ectocarpus sp. 6 AP-2014]